MALTWLYFADTSLSFSSNTASCRSSRVFNEWIVWSWQAHAQARKHHETTSSNHSAVTYDHYTYEPFVCTPSPGPRRCAGRSSSPSDRPTSSQCVTASALVSKKAPRLVPVPVPVPVPARASHSLAPVPDLTLAPPAYAQDSRAARPAATPGTPLPPRARTGRAAPTAALAVVGIIRRVSQC